MCWQNSTFLRNLSDFVRGYRRERSHDGRPPLLPAFIMATAGREALDARVPAEIWTRILRDVPIDDKKYMLSLALVSKAWTVRSTCAGLERGVSSLRAGACFVRSIREHQRFEHTTAGFARTMPSVRGPASMWARSAPGVLLHEEIGIDRRDGSTNGG
jgi:hypothetical protein